MGGDDLVALVEARQVQANHVVEQHEPMPAGALGQRDEAGQQGAWNVKHRERASRQHRGYRASQGGDEAGRAVAEIWKWLSGIDGQRRQHGQRHARILCLLEHAAVELQPRQLAIDEGAGVHGARLPLKVSRSRMPSPTPRVQTTSRRYPPNTMASSMTMAPARMMSARSRLRPRIVPRFCRDTASSRSRMAVTSD